MCVFQTIKDYQLIGIVCGLVGVVISIMVVWEIVAPQQIAVKELLTEVSIIWLFAYCKGSASGMRN